ncbi:MAG: hypothetical protein KatS3mg105_3015 [Gemmatales bacterium]|nr:MAG: hypothetical protein KatS3mg105_3015 [Gemmatales bacterium]
MGRPSIPPGVYFRMILVGYFEGVSSQRGIAWRCSDSRSLAEFLGYGPQERTPDHSSMSRTQQTVAAGGARASLRVCVASGRRQEASPRVHEVADVHSGAEKETSSSLDRQAAGVSGGGVCEPSSRAWRAGQTAATTAERVDGTKFWPMCVRPAGRVDVGYADWRR